MREAFGRGGSVSVQGCVMITIPGCLIIIELIIHLPFLPGDVPSGNVHDGSMHLGVLQEWFGILVLLRSSSLLFLLCFHWSCSGVWDHGENSVAMLKFPENMEFNEGSHADYSVKESD
ncbi:hypothetical protein Peur_006141 [Populus x canadensis]